LSGQKFKGTLNFTYTQEGSAFSHSKLGTLTAKYE
jgi:hypothetical protein